MPSRRPRRFVLPPEVREAVERGDGRGLATWVRQLQLSALVPPPTEAEMRALGRTLNALHQRAATARQRQFAQLNTALDRGDLLRAAQVNRIMRDRAEAQVLRPVLDRAQATQRQRAADLGRKSGARRSQQATRRARRWVTYARTTKRRPGVSLEAFIAHLRRNPPPRSGKVPSARTLRTWLTDAGLK
jgi:hypothetical protein